MVATASLAAKLASRTQTKASEGDSNELANSIFNNPGRSGSDGSGVHPQLQVPTDRSRGGDPGQQGDRVICAVASAEDGGADPSVRADTLDSSGNLNRHDGNPSMGSDCVDRIPESVRIRVPSGPSSGTHPPNGFQNGPIKLRRARAAQHP